ncbi:site-2 protease family protein [Pseudonocardia acaciae]|uniref:site-2 protease family protein n=1 Tax=Pseudonocardia acaciae TaxID=551276 RepID=UPI000AEB6084|nr:site-2 protease family protein [Pseudonocardia acaciae]
MPDRLRRRPRQSPVSPIFLLLLAITVGGGVLSTVPNEVSITAGVMLLVLAGWAVSLCLHEFAHAAVAYRGGDTSVANKGYLTLDIRRYLNPMLSFVLPLFFVLAGGIPLVGGAVWINDWAIRSRFNRSMVSLAGPMINLVLGALLAVVSTSVPMPIGLFAGLSYLALVQVLAFVLNILPIPGLDGFGVLEPYLSPDSRELAAKVRPWAPLAFFVLLLGVPALGSAFFWVGDLIFSAFGGSSRGAGLGHSAFTPWLR